MPRITASTTLTTAPADILAYRLVPSHTSVNIRYVNGVLTPDVANITLRVTKQQGEDTPVTVQPANWSAEGLTVGYQYLDGDTVARQYDGSNIAVVAANKGIKANLHRGGVLIDSVTVGFTVDGVRGSRGPALRIQRWEDVPVGFQFENGAEGCTYLDVVTYGTGFYSCRTSHPKNASVPPPTGVSAAYMQWIGTTPFDILATKLFFAEYALIENLGVESLEMYARDSSGNIITNTDGTPKVIALIKDGRIVINSGEFKDVSVAGDITANTLSLKFNTAVSPDFPNGSFLYQTNTIRLPELPPNTTRTYKIMNPVESRATPGNLVLTGATSKCFVTLGLNPSGSTQTLTVSGGGANGGRFYDLLGFNPDNASGSTYWYLVDIYKNS